MAENTSAKQVDKVTIRVLVDKKKNKVLFAEADKDFVDVLLSFLTLRLGTIAKLVANDSNIEALSFGSISSLYQSVSDLDEKHLWSQTCKEMLINPRNSVGAHCQNMKLNIDNTDTLQSYYLCENETCEIENGYCSSFFRNQKCICGKLLIREKFMILSKEIGFVNETSTFIVSDDLYVMPNVVTTSLNILQKLGVNDIDAIDKQTVNINITKKEVVDLLKLSLVSKTPLSDFIFKKEQFVENLVLSNQLEVNIGKEKEESDEMVVKVLRRKSNEQILFVEADDDFADFVFSFLTFPLGAVLHILQGISFVSCIDNLYKSVTELSSDKCLRSQHFKDMLTIPKISAQFELTNQILPIPCNDYKVRNMSVKFVDPKSPISGGYARAPLTFMVTDQLVVTPMPSIDGISYLERMNVPLNDVEEMVVNIGQKEGLSILRASLTSKFALTNGLNQFIGSRSVQANLSSNASPLKMQKPNDDTAGCGFFSCPSDNKKSTKVEGQDQGQIVGTQCVECCKKDTEITSLTRKLTKIKSNEKSTKSMLMVVIVICLFLAMICFITTICLIANNLK